MTVHLGRREVRLRSSAGATRRATRSHTFRTPGFWRLATLLVSPTPYGHGGYPGDWIGTLRRLMKTDAGATLEETRRRARLERFEKEFAGDNPARVRAFRSFFVEPIVERAYQEAKGSLSEEGTVRPK